MIRNLKDTTHQEQRAGLAEDQPREIHPHVAGPKRHAHRRQADPSELAPVVSAQQGVFYIMETPKKTDDAKSCKLLASYAFKDRKNIDNKFKLGEGLVGQCALEKENILLTNVADRLRQDHFRASASASRRTSSCCRSSSKAR